MRELEAPDLNLIKQAEQGAGGSAKSTPYILRGVNEGCNQRGRFCC
jgi:hypothetical protein